MQLATFEINPFCIMQRMPPLPGFATPHPSPETNHCRARACTAPPPPSRAARSHRAAPAAARRLLKRGGRPQGTFAAQPAGARRPGFRRAARSQADPRGAQARAGPPPPGAAFLFRRRLREPGAPGALWERPRPVFGRRRRAQSEPVSGGPGEGGRDTRLKGEYRSAGPRRPLQIPLRAARDRRGAVHGGPFQPCLERGRARAWWGRFKKEAPPAPPPPPRGAGEGGREEAGRSGGGGRPRRG